MTVLLLHSWTFCQVHITDLPCIQLQHTRPCCTSVMLHVIDLQILTIHSSSPLITLLLG